MKPSLFAYVMAAALLAGCGDRIPDSPTFSEHVAPILKDQCAQCHQPGTAAPFSLLTYEDARQQAALIAASVEQRRMPPWLPEPGEHRFKHERRLSDREITILSRWAAQGAPPGDADVEAAAASKADEWAMGPPDLILEMPQPYTLRRSGGDVFRNFVLPVPLDETRYVRAVDLHPGDATVLHHAVMAVDTTEVSRQEDAGDAEPGFDGMFSRRGARPPSGFLVGWTPGRVPGQNPEGLAWALQPGSDLVLQTHLRPHADSARVQARVGLYFADTPPARTPVLLRLGSQTIDIPAGKSDYTVTDSLRLPIEVELLGLYPHAHFLGKSMHVRATRPSGDSEDLLRIDDWDFNWQDAYEYERPVRLPAGSTIHLTYVYDNSTANARNPHKPPRRVVYGPNSTDEMAELWIQALPREESELPALQRQLAQEALRDAVEGWQHLVRVNPDDAPAHANLAAFQTSAGNLDAAVEHYRQAIRAQPDFASAHYNLGILLERSGDLEGASQSYRAAIRARPAHAPSHNNLGNVLLALQRRDEAAVHFRRAIELDPNQAEAHNNLGRYFYESGSAAQAIEHYQRARAVNPAVAAPYFNLALALASIGRTTGALAQFEEGVKRQPDALDATVGLAWMLATHPNAGVRRPVAAVTLAQRASQMFPQPHPRILDVLAAAHAAAGDFDLATSIGERAANLAASTGEGELAVRIIARLELYLARRPYIQPQS